MTDTNDITNASAVNPSRMSHAEAVVYLREHGGTVAWSDRDPAGGYRSFLAFLDDDGALVQPHPTDATGTAAAPTDVVYTAELRVGESVLTNERPPRRGTVEAIDEQGILSVRIGSSLESFPDARELARVADDLEDEGAPEVGYHDCACRDCFDTYVGLPGELCNDCEAHDCDPDGAHECERPHEDVCGGCNLCEPFDSGDRP